MRRDESPVHCVKKQNKKHPRLHWGSGDPKQNNQTNQGLYTWGIGGRAETPIYGDGRDLLGVRSDGGETVDMDEKEGEGSKNM